jgi:hypothetical protein
MGEARASVLEKGLPYLVRGDAYSKVQNFEEHLDHGNKVIHLQQYMGRLFDTGSPVCDLVWDR